MLVVAKNLNEMLNPKSIAVIGASSNPDSLGGQPIRHLLENGYTGQIYPINSKYEQVQGLECYSSIGVVPHKIDLALIIVRAHQVADIIEECGKKEIRFAIIYSSGFSELGEDGVKLQQEVIDRAEKYGITFLGPNCQGIMNIPSKVFAGFGSVFEARPFYPGKVSMVTQSGGFGYSAVNVAQEQGLGFNIIVSSGNEANLKSEDLMEYFIEDEETEIISAYIEGSKAPDRILAIGKQALRAEKPVLVWKVGRSEIGSRAAASHTGSMAGKKELYDAVFKQAGIIPIEDIYDLIDFTSVYEQKKLPKGNRLGIITVSGGAGVLVSDKSSEFGLEIPELNSETKEMLLEVIPSFASTMNPVDVTAQVFNDPSALRKAMDMIVQDENIDMLMILNANMHGSLGTEVAKQIVEVAKATDKPVAVSWSAREHLNEEGFSILKNHAIPNFKTPVRGVKALSQLSYFSEAVWKEKQEKVFLEISDDKRDKVKELLKEITEIPTEYEAKKMLAHYGIPLPQQRLVEDEEGACQAAEEMGYPLVIKVMSSELLHKTEAKAVKINIQNEEELRQAYREVLVNTRNYIPDIKIDGVLVTPMIKNNVECILGIQNDPQFGPAIMFGLGGVYTEVLKDISFRMSVLTHEEALEMVKEIKSYPILEGVRGNKESDIQALADVIVRLSIFAHDCKNSIDELDINPLFVLPKGEGVVVGDALIVPKHKNQEIPV